MEMAGSPPKPMTEREEIEVQVNPHLTHQDEGDDVKDRLLGSSGASQSSSTFSPTTVTLSSSTRVFAARSTEPVVLSPPRRSATKLGLNRNPMYCQAIHKVSPCVPLSPSSRRHIDVPPAVVLVSADRDDNSYVEDIDENSSSNPRESTVAVDSLRNIIVDEISERLHWKSPPRSTGTRLSRSFDSEMSPDRLADPSLIRGVIGPVAGIHGRYDNTDEVAAARACPCCRRYVENVRRSPSRKPNLVPQEERAPEEESGRQSKNLSGSSFDSTLFGSFTIGMEYEVREVLVQGWVHKKGTGRDWLGSRSWKPRWACLAMAFVPGYEVDVPVLLVYWHPSLLAPSNFIILDSSTVVVPVDRFKQNVEGPKRGLTPDWNTFSFDVVHAGQSEQGQESIKQDRATRTFSLPHQKERNEWVFAINQALFDYEKRLKKERAQRARHLQSQICRSHLVEEEGSFVGNGAPISPARHSSDESHGIIARSKSFTHCSLPPTSPTRSYRRAYSLFPNVVS